MLRVSPDGKVIWVQTQGTNENIVLDVETMGQLNSSQAGIDPEQSAFQPGGPYGLIAHIASNSLVVLEATSGDRVGQIKVGESQGNICYGPDGATAFVTSLGGNEVIVVDMLKLTVVGSIPTGAAPQGLVLLDINSGSTTPRQSTPGFPPSEPRSFYEG
jgi:YVTN family beta-propeller protein